MPVITLYNKNQRKRQEAVRMLWSSQVEQSSLERFMDQKAWDHSPRPWEGSLTLPSLWHRLWEMQTKPYLPLEAVVRVKLGRACKVSTGRHKAQAKWRLRVLRYIAQCLGATAQNASLPPLLNFCPHGFPQTLRNPLNSGTDSKNIPKRTKCCIYTKMLTHYLFFSVTSTSLSIRKRNSFRLSVYLRVLASFVCFTNSPKLFPQMHETIIHP